MVTRRDFLKTAAIAGSTSAIPSIRALASRHQESDGYFGVHPFIENHPDSVFIMRTHVNDYMDSAEKKDTGLTFSRSVFVPRDDGTPITALIPIKPNMRMEFGWQYGSSARKTAESRVQGYKGTDAFFTEGLIEGMKELGLSAGQFFLREVNLKPDGFGSVDYPGVAERTDVEMRYMGDKVGVIDENDLVWVDTPEGIWYRKIPYLWPVNAPDTFLVNIAKFKAHSMGLTLCAKNLQGTIAKNYHQHCLAFTSTMDMDYEHVNPNAHEEINENYFHHYVAGVPRWDKPGDDTFNSGLGMETWASRCIDNNRVTQAGLHIIEGIYGIDGHFGNGPHPPGDINDPYGESWEYLTNYIIFGLNAFHVDIVGHWLGGHEPGNFGLFHMAKENGLSQYLNPMDIPLYDWTAEGAVLTDLAGYQRTPLLTYYLQRDYGDQSENYWHLADEPFDYPSISVADTSRPAAFVLEQNYPNPFNPYTGIEYQIPRSGHVSLNIYNAAGQIVDVIVDSYRKQGAHMETWNTNNHPSGLYFYRLTYAGHTETKKMMLLK